MIMENPTPLVTEEDKKTFAEMLQKLEEMGKCLYKYHQLSEKLFGEDVLSL